MTYTVNCSILLTELPLLERPAAAKVAGFDAVEFWWPFETAVPTDAQITEFENAITDTVAQPAYYLDNIELGFATQQPAPAPTGSLTLSINTSADRYAISPYIYGSNMDFRDVDRLPARRLDNARPAAASSLLRKQRASGAFREDGIANANSTGVAAAAGVRWSPRP